MNDFISIADIGRGGMEELLLLAADLKRSASRARDLDRPEVPLTEPVLPKPNLHRRIPGASFAELVNMIAMQAGCQCHHGRRQE